MTKEEFLEHDHQFNESVFLSKANNRIKNLYQSITLKQFERTKGFLSDYLYEELQSKLRSYQEDKMTPFYDEINIDSDIRNYSVSGDFFVIDVTARIRYLKYFLSTENGEIVSGDDRNRVEVVHHAVFKKRITSDSDDYRCFGCGSTILIENAGKCPACGRVYDLDTFDYILDVFD